jgi:HEAT repeat protein
MTVGDRIHQLFEQLRTADFEQGFEIGERILEESKEINTYEPLIPYLGDKFWKLRRYAAQALGNFDDPEVARHLIEQFGKETEADDEEVQVEIVTTLGNQKTLFALQSLIAIAQDDSLTSWVRSTAVSSIAISTIRNVIDPLFELLSEPAESFDPDVVDSVFAAFDELEEDDTAIPGRLTALLASRTIPDRHLAHAIVFLGRRRFLAAVDVLLTFVDDSDYIFRQLAARALGSIGDRRALPKLVSMLDDPREEVRRAVADAIQQLETK